MINFLLEITETAANGERILYFLSNSLNPANPPDNVINGVNALTLLEVPSFNVRLSEAVSGITLHQGFSVNLHNNNGRFDLGFTESVINNPVVLKKSTVPNPRHENFREIRRGHIANVIITMDTVTLEIGDLLQGMDNPANIPISMDMFTDIPGVPSNAVLNSLDAEVIGTPAPVFFGNRARGSTPNTWFVGFNWVRPVRLNDRQYLTHETAARIRAVRTGDGVLLQPGTLDPNPNNGNQSGGGGAHVWVWNVRNRVFTIDRNNPNFVPAEILLESSVLDVGDAIRWLFTNRTGLSFDNTNFNVSEFDRISGTFVTMEITGGNVRNVINTVLRNGQFYLIQQNDGRLTLRSYTVAVSNSPYAVHTIQPWVITQKPEINYRFARENYFSSCLVHIRPHGMTIAHPVRERHILFNERESDAVNRYRRNVQKEFRTDITNCPDALQFAGNLGDRFTAMKPTVRLAVGVDTSRFELLDRVRVDIAINGRRLCDTNEFIIKGINHCQDILELEGV